MTLHKRTELLPKVAELLIAMKGRTSIYISRGLADLVNLHPKTDEEVTRGEIDIESLEYIRKEEDIEDYLAGDNPPSLIIVKTTKIHRQRDETAMPMQGRIPGQRPRLAA